MNIDAKPIFTFLAVLVVVSLMISINIALWRPQGQPLSDSSTRGNELLTLTGTTGQLSGEDYLASATAYSQAVYASAQDKDRPQAVVLVRDDDPASAITTTRLQHFPVNAPMLYVTNNGQTLPDVTKKELERLHPEGVFLDNYVKVYLVGDISESIASEVEAMGFKTRTLYANNAIQLSEVIDEYLAILEDNHRNPILLGYIEALEYAYPAANWNAHHGDGFAFLTTEGIPNETRSMLLRRWPNYPYIYVFAPPSLVSEEVMAELSEYGHVQRIPGETPQDMAVAWAGYKDLGMSEEWWLFYLTRSIGWGISEPGHNLILANPADWREIIPSGVLSHMGKHAFLLLTNPDSSLPEKATSFLQVIKPTETHPSQQVFNYAWIIGRNIGNETVRQLDSLLSVR